ncbi:MAG: hypothetical protein ACXWDM_11975 [Nocardioides sp.]
MDDSRNSYHRRFVALTVGVLLATSGAVVAATLPAYGAPPGNDSIANARTITGIPTRIVQDTREASPSADDGECVFGDSVWYRFRPTTTRTGRVVTIGSTFDSVLAVFRGPRDRRTLVACSDDAVGLDAAAQVRFTTGTRYWIAVSACCRASAAGGGSVLTLYRPRPAATTVSLDLDSVETGAVSGRIFASGTVSCNTPSSVAAVSVTVSQRVGTFVARGTGFADVPLCDRTARSWSVQVDSETAIAFQEGVASVTVGGDSFDGFSSTTTTEQPANVTVRSNPNRMPRN